MKKATVFLLILSLVFILASCKAAENEETTSATEETSESVSGIVGSEEMSSSDEQSSSEISVAATENTEDKTTENFADETPSESVTVKEEPITVTDDKIIASDYSLDIPKDFEVKSDGNDPLLENKQGTIQFNIMDKTKVVKDYDTYVSDTYKAAESSGIAKSDIEDVTIKDIPMKRFAMTIKNDGEAELDSYVYILNVNNKVLMITLTSKDGGLKDVAAADKFVAEIDFLS